MSAGVTPASAKAAAPDTRAPDHVRSTSPPCWPFTYSPAPSTFTFGRLSFAAISGRATISAPPPSDTTQQSMRRSGSEIIGERITSSTVSTSRSMAFGLCCAWCEADTLIHASCSDVVPNSCMWRIATIA
ncbi:hypothetical protein D9M68_456380 [compost metagenome]